MNQWIKFQRNFIVEQNPLDFVALDAEEQAYLLLHLAENYNNNRGKVAIQLDYVSDEMANYLTNEDVRSINRFLDLVRDYTENALLKDTDKEDI